MTSSYQLIITQHIFELYYAIAAIQQRQDTKSILTFVITSFHVHDTLNFYDEALWLLLYEGAINVQ